MARPLPYSLAPHICISQSQDAARLLSSSALPALDRVLQLFCPIPQITTHTSAFNAVVHANFMLRFSDLLEVEDACKEGESQRATRTIDWMSARVADRCSQWVKEAEVAGTDDIREGQTPWWDELKRCSEGDGTPVEAEGWNHPVAMVYVTSTNSPNPLQDVTSLLSRQPALPSFVDQNYMKYILVLHPEDSALNVDETKALINAIKKQFVVPVYLLDLQLPSPPPSPVPVPAFLPRLLPFSNADTRNGSGASGSSSDNQEGLQGVLRMSPVDIQSTARFVREFVTISLIPWMEKNMLDWNEMYSSTRRLPSRLFTSTRRFFGGTQAASSGSAPSGGTSNASLSPTHQRRLAEFATMLGDYKLAATVWETLRKETRGLYGSDILPILASPTIAVRSYALQALELHYSSLSNPPAQAQVRGIAYAVRWQTGIHSTDFMGSTFNGPDWLVTAAANIEEVPAALLLAQAASLSAKKGHTRRSIMWYCAAARRLEKCGVKPLTRHLLQTALRLYSNDPDKSLSPLFADAEAQQNAYHGFDAILPSIKHPLARILYTNGLVQDAVKLFLDLLAGSSSSAGRSYQSLGSEGDASLQQIFIEDFRVAFDHFINSNNDEALAHDLKLPFSLVDCASLKVRSRENVLADGVLRRLQEQWPDFQHLKNIKTLDRAHVADAGETIWIDVPFVNPLEVSVTLRSLKIGVTSPDGGPIASQDLAVEDIDEIVLLPLETRLVPFAVVGSHPLEFAITQISFEFLGLLPVTQSFPAGVKSEQASPADESLIVQIREGSIHLDTQFVDQYKLELLEGEYLRTNVQLVNSGTETIDEIWFLSNEETHISTLLDVPDLEDEDILDRPAGNLALYRNSIGPRKPVLIPVERFHGSSSLRPSEAIEIPILLHAHECAELDFRLTFIYRKVEDASSRAVACSRMLRVHPLLEVTVSANDSDDASHPYTLEIAATNLSSDCIVEVTDINALSSVWEIQSLLKSVGSVADSPSLRGDVLTLSGSRLSSQICPPGQATRIALSTSMRVGSPEMKVWNFAAERLADIINGEKVELLEPPPISLAHSHCELVNASAERDITFRRIAHITKRSAVKQDLAHMSASLPPMMFPYLFPMFHPLGIDVFVSWRAQGQNRRGFILVPNILLGAGHGPLTATINGLESSRTKRTLFAETIRDQQALLAAIRRSDWNYENEPVRIVVQCPQKVVHDFFQGPLLLPVSYVAHNISTTHTAEVALTLNDNEVQVGSGHCPPVFLGSLTRRFSLMPSRTETIQTKILVSQPGNYSLNGWSARVSIEGPSPGRAGPAQEWKIDGTRVTRLEDPMQEEHAFLLVEDSASSLS